MDIRPFYPLPRQGAVTGRPSILPAVGGLSVKVSSPPTRAAGAEWLSTDEYTTMAATNRLLNNETDTPDKRFQS